MSPTLLKNPLELGMAETAKGFSYNPLGVANFWLEISGKPIYIDHLSFLSGVLVK